MEIKHNQLIINNKQISFNNKIQEVKILNETTIVLLNVDGSLDNVYGINSDGEIIWKIKEPNEKKVGNNRFPYVGISIKDEKVAVIDFYGRRFFVNEKNGEIVDSDFVK